MCAPIDIDQIFREDNANPPSERTLPWEETRDGVTVVVEPKPHWADDMRAFRLEARAYCRYEDWTSNGGHARFYGHIDTSGDDVMMTARAMIAARSPMGSGTEGPFMLNENRRDPVIGLYGSSSSFISVPFILFGIGFRPRPRTHS